MSSNHRPTDALSGKACVRTELIPTASGHVFGRLTLNTPASLNALSLPMIEQLASQLDIWATDAQVVGVLLDGAGDKAFCAGGDVVTLYREILAQRAVAPDAVPQGAADFFEREYRLDYRMHTYPKPILCWAHGVVMGGGIGLLAAASHQVVTPATRLAMPEISIGLFPDVGGSWFLNRMPGRTGLFVAMSGVALNANDALFSGLADFALNHDSLAAVVDQIGQASWVGERAEDGAMLSHLLEAVDASEQCAPSALREHLKQIDRVIGHDMLEDVALRLLALRDDAAPWLRGAANTYAQGSPTSAALAFALQETCRLWSLADVFRLEYQAALGCCMHADFVEGVRALLIDKDKQPMWNPSSLAQVGDALIEDHLRARFDGAHPLVDLV